MTLFNTFTTNVGRLFATLNVVLVAAAVALLVHVYSAAVYAGENVSAVSASDLMVRAHQARATWTDFPGFTADISITTDGSALKGRLTVSESFEVKVDVADAATPEWADRQLRSLVMHRQDNDERQYDVSFADDVRVHPLGRLIKFNEDRLHSVYRINDDVITEVHRTMGDSRFTITVFEVARNAEKKYLPQTYAVSFWDAKSGDLKDASTTRTEWIRIGRFDLPSRLLSVTSGNGGNREVREITFRQHRLLTASTTR